MFVKKFFAVLALILLTCSTCAAEMKFDTLAAAYVDGEKQILMLIRDKASGEIFFMPFDAETETGVFVKFEQRLYNFYTNRSKDGDFAPLMFVMATTAQSDKSDDRLGVWNGDAHVIPVYALFDVVGEQVTVDNLWSGEETLTPSHYHAPIKNPIHRRLIEILLTKMPLLHNDVQAKGVELPQ